MKKNIIYVLIAFLLVAGIAFFVYERNQQSLKQYQNKVILFYSKYCPHCKNVETFISEHPAVQKMSIIQEEVSSNQDNMQTFMDIAWRCGVTDGQYVVPLLWTGETCITGDQPIINFLQNELQK